MPTQTDPPLISVVVPVYNAERFLAEAIKSIFAQHHRPLDVIVIDDGSDDGSAEVAKKFADVRYVYQENQGQATARNHGVRLARGDLIAFLDADDVWEERKLELQMSAFDAEPELDMVFGHAEQFIDRGAADTMTLSQDRRILPARLPSAILIRRESFLRVGDFNTRWSVGEVVDWLSRAVAANLKERTLGEVVYRRRLHGANLGTRVRNASEVYLDVVRAALQRRKSESGQPIDPPAEREQDDA